MKSEETQSIDIGPQEFKKKLEEDPGIVIDVRTRKEYDEGHLSITDRQLDIMTGEFQNELDRLDKEKSYYLYCRSGSRSGKAARMMRHRGFDKAHNVGGFQKLAASGFETEE